MRRPSLSCIAGGARRPSLAGVVFYSDEDGKSTESPGDTSAGSGSGDDDPCMMEEGLLMSPMCSMASSPKEPTFATLTITKSRPDQLWGLDMEWITGFQDCFVLNDAQPGSALEDYNKSLGPDMFLVRQYDVLHKINGKTNCLDMMDALKWAGDTITIEVSRPKRSIRVIKKDHRPLGLTFKSTEGGKTVSVKGVAEDGLAKIAGYDLRVGDLILEVNDISGSSRAMMKEVREASVLEFTIGRIQHRL